MATWTQADLDAVKAAIISIAKGERKVSVSFSGGGGSRSVTYQAAQLGELKTLKTEIEKDLGLSRRTVLSSQRSKGL